MAKRLPLEDIPPQVKNFLKQLDLEKDEYILDLGGKSMVGIVSPRQVEQFSQRREEILALLQQSWDRNRAVPEEEVRQAVSETIEEVRHEKT